MTGTSEVTSASGKADRVLGPNYKWIALSNTTLGVLMATINQSIVLIALPAVFKGIGLDPLGPGNTSYLLWMFMGFMVVTAVLVVSFGRLGDMFGRVRMYNLGFAVFTVASIFLTVTWMHGVAGALWLIIWRVVQGIGGAFLFANSTAILTDAFPANQRGTALGLNSIAAIAGSFIGLILGGVLAPVNWHLIFLVSAPVGLFGTVWAYFMLHDIGIRKHAKMDWWGNLLFGVGLIAILVGITYGLQPYGSSAMGWTNPFVLGAMIGGIVLLIVFVFVEQKVDEPCSTCRCSRSGPSRRETSPASCFALGPRRHAVHAHHLAPGHLAAAARLQLQPDPVVGGHLPAAADARVLAVRAAVRRAVGPLRREGVHRRRLAAGRGDVPVLIFVPVNFPYWESLSSSRSRVRHRPVRLTEPRRDDELGPGRQRGAAGGMIATLHELRVRALDRAIFFSLMVAGLASRLPASMFSGLTAQGIPASAATDDLAPAADRRAVRRLPRLQPDAAAARAAAQPPAVRARRLRDRARVLPEPQAPGRSTTASASRSARHRGQRHRGGRVRAHRPEQAAAAAPGAGGVTRV